MSSSIAERASAIAYAGSIGTAVKEGKIAQFNSISVSEAIVLGLINQGVKKYIGIFGHGSTQIGEVLRIYEGEGLVKVYNVRHETEASHIASALKWQYGETAAVFTSIGPGAMQALAGSLVSSSNGLGIYYIFGDETSQDEGFNMQQIASHEQSLFLKTMSHLGDAYSIHTPEAVTAALKNGINAVFNPIRQKPFFMLAPMNTQPVIIEEFNLLELPAPLTIEPDCCSEKSLIPTVESIRKHKRIVIKTGRGALGVSPLLMNEFIEVSGAVYVHGPAAGGIIPSSHSLNMGVGGSKGSICGNYAMENAELLISIGSRAVCQWDSSGTAWKKVSEVININRAPEDAVHYNRTIPLVGDAEGIISRLIQMLKKMPAEAESFRPWHEECTEKKAEWKAFRNLRYDNPVINDDKFKTPLLTQPAAIKVVADFAAQKNAHKVFDAGDVQANGFQIVEDETPHMTYTETGASYMGYAVSAVVAGAMADNPQYTIAFTGDGSFMMNPQALIDAVQHGSRGMIALFDNRRMAAISSLQEAQYGNNYKTDDAVEIDYLKFTDAINGVKAFNGGNSPGELKTALDEAWNFDGLSLVYIPVYFGNNELGGLGAFGSWNVGNWCETVQKEKHRIGL